VAKLNADSEWKITIKYLSYDTKSIDGADIIVHGIKIYIISVRVASNRMFINVDETDHRQYYVNTRSITIVRFTTLDIRL